MSFSTQSAGTAVLDDHMMTRALRLAWQGVGRTHPNPLVGALVVRGEEIAGTGYHRSRGHDHAEVAALDEAGARAEGATLYVTLEPCAHHGHTPPCVDRIIRSGVQRVVFPTLDPDPRVCGRGRQTLRDHGVAVETGCRADEALLLNLSYYQQRLGLGTTVTLKMAQTLDGKIASGVGKRNSISGEGARRFVHELRANHNCVLVGIETLLTDRPRLDCRMLERDVEVPVPAVLDSNLRFPRDYHWATQGRRFVVLTGESDPDRDSVLACARDEGGINVADALKKLEGAGLDRVLVEGGARVFSSFVRAEAWDAMIVITSPQLFGAGAVASFTGEVHGRLNAVAVESRRYGNDFSYSYINGETHARILTRLGALEG